MAKQRRSGTRKKGGGGARRRNPAARQERATSSPERAGAGEEEKERSGWQKELLAEVLRPTYWFDPGNGEGEPYSLTISFSGRTSSSAPRAGASSFDGRDRAALVALAYESGLVAPGAVEPDLMP